MMKNFNFLCCGYGSSRINVLNCNVTKNDITYLSSVEVGNSPSWIACHGTDDDRLIFVANEVKNFGADKNCGAITCLRLLETGEFSFVSRVSSGGAWPCHIHVVESLRYIVVSNYFDGHTCIIPYSLDGNLLGNDMITLKYQNPVRRGDQLTRAGNHAHDCEEHNGYLYCVDLGLDFIFKFPVSDIAVSGQRERVVSTTSNDGLQLPLGCGPRHIKFHPHLNVAFALNECSNTLMVLDVNPSNGALTLPQMTQVVHAPKLTMQSVIMRLLLINVLTFLVVTMTMTSIRIEKELVLTTMAVVTGILVCLHHLGYELEWKTANLDDGSTYFLGNCLSTLSTNGAVDSEQFEFMNAAELMISKNGKFLYVSNRDVRKEFEDSTNTDEEFLSSDRSCISVFRIHDASLDFSFDTQKLASKLKLVDLFNSRAYPRNYRSLLNGKVLLECIQIVHSHGNHPRHFALTNDDCYLLIANQRSNNLVTCSINRETGIIDENSFKEFDTRTLKSKVLQPAFILPMEV